jgi:hypothetical protein
MAAVRTLIFYLVYGVFLSVAGIIGVEWYLQGSDSAYKRLRYYVYNPPMYRASDYIPYQLRPNFKDQHFRRGEFSVDVAINSQGFREDREIAIPKPPGTFRILTLGDSYTFAYGVQRHEAFQAILETILNERAGGTKKFEVVNMGFASGHSPDAAFLFMKKEAIAYEPDLILNLLCYDNDLHNIHNTKVYSDYDSNGLPSLLRMYYSTIIRPDNGEREGRLTWEQNRAEELFFPELSPRRFAAGSKKMSLTWHDVFHFELGKIERNSRLLDAVRRYLELHEILAGDKGFIGAGNNFLKLPEKPGRVGEVLLDYGGEGPDGLVHPVRLAGWRGAKKIFPAMKRFADDNNVPFAVVLVPNPIMVDFDPEQSTSKFDRMFDRAEMAKAYRLNKPNRLFGGYFKKVGIPYLDPTNGMREGRDDDLYFEYDAHWNAAGNKRLGEVMADWLVGTRWLPAKP